MKNFKKNFWIQGVSLYEINGSKNIPTTILYDEGSILFGLEAYKKQGKVINQDFKIKLGDHQIGSENYKTYPTNTGREKSAYEISQDYFHKVLSSFESSEQINLEQRLKIKIIVAEPISFKKDKDDEKWITNYRKNIKRILSSYGEIDFLPEPFAVYQYYKYGLKFISLQGKEKNIVLIIDFGGGTFDVSIIETTISGDISQSGRHSKPLASKSKQFGGFKVNQKIAEYLIMRPLESKQDKHKADDYIKTFYRIDKGELKINQLNNEKNIFIKNMYKLLENIEQPKIKLCNSIKNWDIAADCYEKVVIELPKNIFKEDTEWYSGHFYGHELKKIFIEKIWPSELKETITSTIKQAKEQLEEKTISAILISGGSSNIRWLEKMLSSDLGNDFLDIEPISLNESFQEIVAKGLAIECARRFYEENSEFKSVVYNPVKLFLKPDEKDLEEKTKFLSVENKIDMGKSKDNDLISSAQFLKNFINEPLQWKFKLNKPPKNYLTYYFSKTNIDKTDENLNINDIYNIDSKVLTPKNPSFESSIRIELLISEDGTTIPKFIYHTQCEEKQIPECSIKGEPFVIDMTYDSKPINASQYIGFDFGSSNSSLCILTNSDIQIINDRNHDKNWLELNDLLPHLPYPVAFPLRKYIATIDKEKAANNARDAFEALLAFAAYTSFAELIANEVEYQSILKNFAHRSMGPLKAMLENSLQLLGKKAKYSSEYKKLFDLHCEAINTAIDRFNDHKHKKIKADEFDINTPLKIIANLCKQAMTGKSFVYCEDSQKISRSKYKSILREAKDQPPFIDHKQYTSSISLTQNEVYIINSKDKEILPLTPLIFVSDTKELQNSKRFFIFDKKDKTKQYTAKAIDSDYCNSYEMDISELIDSIYHGDGSKIIEKIPLQIEEENIGL